jgi:putative endonuclease
MALAQFIAKLFSSAPSNSSSSRGGEDERQRLGRHGEGLAARFLRENDFKVLYRNFRASRGGEVDIVCRDRRANTLVFVEVKTRSSTEFGRPAEAVKSDKQRLIARGALAWLRMLDNPDVLFRFDIVEVLIRESGEPEITLIRDAFQLPEPYIY